MPHQRFFLVPWMISWHTCLFHCLTAAQLSKTSKHCQRHNEPRVCLLQSTIHIMTTHFEKLVSWSNTTSNTTTWSHATSFYQHQHHFTKYWVSILTSLSHIIQVNWMRDIKFRTQEMAMIGPVPDNKSQKPPPSSPTPHLLIRLAY